MTNWHFRKKYPNEKSRNPMQDEFFASNSETNALVREAIQNSIDACLDKSKPVKVRIFISDDTDNRNVKTSKWFNNSSWSHFHSEGSGLRDVPRNNEKCSYLVYEDFNTKGLTGDISQDAKTSNSNAFYHFLRAEGQSDKVGGELGSWGVGKIVFPKSSRIRSFFVLTNRSDDNKSYLAGQSILKYHCVTNKEYSPDGWFGKINDKEFGLPIDDNKILVDFKNDFNLVREKENGLSVVIPYLDSNINFKNIANAVVKEYFYSILKEKIEVTITCKDEELLLTKDGLDEIFNKKYIENNVKSLVELALNSITMPDKEIIKLREYKENRPDWSTELIPEVNKKKISTGLDAGKTLKIQVPIKIISKTNDKEKSYFHVILKKESDSKLKSMFIRDGLVISKVGTAIIHGYTSIVYIDEPCLSTFLGNAENPAHTEWNDGSDKFKGKYNYGKDSLKFIRLSVKKIINIIQEDDEEADTELLKNIFFIYKKDPNIKEVSKKRRKPKKPIRPTPKDIQKKYAMLNRLENGFEIKGHDKFEGKRKFTISMGYDVIKGDPIKLWAKEDFTADTITTEHSENLTNINFDKNVISFETTSNEFNLKVSGFDNKRDLKINSRNRTV